MRTVALIPARKGSKRIPGKNMVEVGGHPLIWYSIVTALSCDSIQEVYVSTDSEEIADYAKDELYPRCKVIKRPPNLAQDNSTPYDYISHAVIAGIRPNPDLVVVLLPTSPLRSLSIVTAAITAMTTIIEQTEARHKPTSLRSIEKMSESAWKCFELEGGVVLKGMGKITVERAGESNQTFPETFRPNGYIDIVRSELVIKDRLAYGSRVYGYLTPRITEIDEPEDLERLKFDLATKRGEDVLFRSMGKGPGRQGLD